MTMRVLLLPLPLLLSACVVPVPLPPGTPGAIEIPLDPGDACGARGLRGLVGEPAAAADALRVVGPDGTPRTVRVLRPGDPVTEDFSPARIDVRVGADGTVDAVDCG